MKNLIIVAITFFTINVVAQEKKIKVTSKKTKQIEVKNQSAEANAKAETIKLTKQLQLTLEQQNSVYSIMQEHYGKELSSKQKVKKIASSDKSQDIEGTKEVAKEYKNEYSKKLDNQLKNILTIEQYKNYQLSKNQNQKVNQKLIKKKN